MSFFISSALPMINSHRCRRLHARWQPVRSAGFTLIELMVSLVLGLVVIGGVMGVFISTYQANAQNIKAIRLNEEMRAVMSMITRDVRRAGVRALAWQPSLLGSPNPFSTATLWSITNMSGAPARSCILLAYSITNDNGAAPQNRYGYRLNRNTGSVEAYNHTALGDWSCDGNNWQPLTDSSIAWIQTLQFTQTLEYAVTSTPTASDFAVRTVVVNLQAATRTRSITPAATNPNCNDIDLVCRQTVEKIRIRNDAAP